MNWLGSFNEQYILGAWQKSPLIWGVLYLCSFLFCILTFSLHGNIRGYNFDHISKDALCVKIQILILCDNIHAVCWQPIIYKWSCNYCLGVLIRQILKRETQNKRTYNLAGKIQRRQKIFQFRKKANWRTGGNKNFLLFQVIVICDQISSTRSIQVLLVHIALFILNIRRL